MRQVPGIVDRLDTGIGNPMREVVGIVRCDNAVRHSQMISVGAAIRWMRFLRLRSGIGQANGVMLLNNDDLMRLEDAPFRETQDRTELA
jgi:hypothetical protein